MMRLHSLYGAIVIWMAMCFVSQAEERLSGYASHAVMGRSVVITSDSGQRLRLTPYTDYMVRVQAVRKDEDFLPDSYYETIERHDLGGAFSVTDNGKELVLAAAAGDGLIVRVSKSPLRLAFFQNGGKALVKETGGITWENKGVFENFAGSATNHFCGLGHGTFGGGTSMDLNGKSWSRSYGAQAPLLVPFFISSAGYGIFLNSTFNNRFTFGNKTCTFGLTVAGQGERLDYVLILGPSLPAQLDRYTQLTGRPRLPPLSMFGLQLSDKGRPSLSDAEDWKQRITQHRAMGFPLDHQVNDNRWREGSGGWSGSWFEFSKKRWPDPAGYGAWLAQQGMTMTLDFNRNNAERCAGWEGAYNIPGQRNCPDYTSPEVRAWNWKVFWDKALNPALKFPGDALWIDEPDDFGVPGTVKLANGRTWTEMANYHFFLIAKAIGQEGWDKAIGEAKRPFIWMRGGSAGGQRHACMWTGDIGCGIQDMQPQVAAMLAAGLSGFPYFNHDAGGFSGGPDDNVYRQWSMAFGSFTPIWRPHGSGKSRWPMERSPECQESAKTYGHLRYELMPYTYTLACQANATGLPMARAMILDYPDEPIAWTLDRQYLWGPSILVAPNGSTNNTVSVWLPGASPWYDFWDDNVLAGNQTISYPAPVGKLPLFVKAGAVIPMALYAQSTAFIKRDILVVQVYTGADGEFTLYEDDGVTEKYRTRKERRFTNLSFKGGILTIGAKQGDYAGAVNQRAYRVNFHGLKSAVAVSVNGEQLPLCANEEDALAKGGGVVWDESRKLLSAYTRPLSVESPVVVR